MWKANHSSVHPSHSLDHSKTPCSTYAHYLLPSRYHHTLSPAHNEFQQMEIFLPIKNEWQNTLILSTLPVQLSFENAAVSVHVIWGADCYCYVVLNTCTNWTYACHPSTETLSAGIKYGTLLSESPLYLRFHNTWGLSMENWKHKKTRFQVGTGLRGMRSVKNTSVCVSSALANSNLVE